MYQVNYNGLKKRESYDEIVATIENDQTKVKYPNRVASQIMNSPFMKQVDGETLMDLQNQQDRMSKQKMKELVLQEIAKQTATPYVELRAGGSPERMDAVMAEISAIRASLEAKDADETDASVGSCGRVERREGMAVVGYDAGDASLVPRRGKRKAPGRPLAQPPVGDAASGCLGGESEAVLHGRRVEVQRFAHEGGGDALGGDLDQAIRLVRGELHALVADLQDPRARREQVHEEILKLDRIVGAVREDAGAVLGKRDVIDGEFGNHGGGGVLEPFRCWVSGWSPDRRNGEARPDSPVRGARSIGCVTLWIQCTTEEGERRIARSRATRHAPNASAPRLHPSEAAVDADDLSGNPRLFPVEQPADCGGHLIGGADAAERVHRGGCLGDGLV